MSDILKGLPRRIRIGQFTLAFKVTTPEEHPAIEGSNGITEFDDSVIYLDKSFIDKAEPQRVLNVVQHEVSHAINLVYGIDDDSTEETFVAQHTNGLVAFWIDNPRFETWRRRMLRDIKKGTRESK